VPWRRPPPTCRPRCSPSSMGWSSITRVRKHALNLSSVYTLSDLYVQASRCVGVYPRVYVWFLQLESIGVGGTGACSVSFLVSSSLLLRCFPSRALVMQALAGLPCSAGTTRAPSTVGRCVTRTWRPRGWRPWTPSSGTTRSSWSDACPSADCGPRRCVAVCPRGCVCVNVCACVCVCEFTCVSGYTYVYVRECTCVYVRARTLCKYGPSRTAVPPKGDVIQCARGLVVFWGGQPCAWRGRRRPGWGFALACIARHAIITPLCTAMHVCNVRCT